jgi:hypothetical protein
MARRGRRKEAPITRGKRRRRSGPPFTRRFSFLPPPPPEDLGEGMVWPLGWSRVVTQEDEAQGLQRYAYRSPDGYLLRTLAMARLFIRTLQANGDVTWPDLYEGAAFRATRVETLTMLRRFVQALAQNGGDEDAALAATRRPA